MANNISVQIGNIVANALLSKSSIYLPRIGSLQVDSIPSKLKSSGRIITPPSYVVKFSSAEVGVNIIDIISSACGGDNAVAESIYGQWVDSISTSQDVVIEGVGTLKNKTFVLTPEFNSILNPEALRELRLKRRRGGLVWVVLSVVACVVVGLGANYISKIYVSSPKVEIEQAEPQVGIAEVEQPPVVDSVEVVEVESPVKPVEPVVVVENPRYRLVYGVFSTVENAQKAVDTISKKSPSVTTNIRPYGKLFMVSVLESDSVEDCKSFMEQNKNTYPDLWISKRRGE
ncbi:MAG: hypothetical protein SNH35_03345 [Rikenellaceae bacterium]